MHGLESSKSCGNRELSSVMPHQSPAAISKRKSTANTPSTEDTACSGTVTREVIILCVIITIVCTLLTLPVIFYHLPLRVQQPGVSTCSYYLFIIILSLKNVVHVYCKINFS